MCPGARGRDWGYGGLFGAGWGDLDLKDKAGKVETDLEVLMAAVGALQEVLAWQQIDGGFEGVCVSDGTGRGADDLLPKTACDAHL